MADDRPSETIEARLESTAFSCDRLRVRKLSGREAISSLFRFDLEIVSLDREGVDAAKMMGAEATLVLEAGGTEVRRIQGMIAEADDLLAGHAAVCRYRVCLVPRASRLAMVETQDVFLDASVPEIIKSKLALVDLGDDDVVLRLSGSYAAREFVVQYKETDLAFVCRLAEHLGISFVFENDHGRDVLVFTDHAAGFRPVPGADSVPFHARGDERYVFDLAVERRLVPSFFAVQDYNYRTPLITLSGEYTLPDGFAGGVVEHGSHFKTPAEGSALAKARAEERQAKQLVYVGKSDVASFAAGARVELTGHPDLPKTELLLVEVEHEGTFTVAGSREGDAPAYRNAFRAVPAAHTYRPPRVTPKPRIAGLATGVIDGGAAGQANVAQLDEQGRYTVRFLFDTNPRDGRKASRPVRMAQHHVGENYGTHFPLKPGTEVVVGFIDGDPDRPIILGAVPNPTKPSPVDHRDPSVHRVRTGSGITVDIQDGS